MKIYCSGIGGIGLSAYAAYQAASGHEVLGSDRSDSPLLEDLRSQGITIFLTQDGSSVPSGCDLFVYSEAIPTDAPERVRARELNIPSQSYFHALGEISKNHFVIAVCGTHGKSSTTAMAARLLMEAGKDPSVIVGTKMKELDGRNWRKGKSDIFVVEACEYRRSFHFLSPDIVLMTNVDGDHFDAFATMDEYHEAFVTFLKRLPGDGIIVTHGKDAECVMVSEASGKKMIDADAQSMISMSVPGNHMRQNAQLVLALATHLGIDGKEATNILSGFSGTWRRMEVKGVKNGVTIVDDYAHHPVEIKATLSAMREAYPDARIICVFQPHTHNRTLSMYNEFLSAFKDADLLIVPNVYAAREVNDQTVDVGRFVADVARESGIEARNGESISETGKWLREAMKTNDVVITMGAGDITKLSGELLK